MDSQIQLIYNGYLKYLNNLNYGNVKQDYTILYYSVLYQKFEINQSSILEFLNSNLP